MQSVFDFEVASALSRGRRPYQEDAIISDFACGSDVGFIVLADGMGGHAAGDVASKIVVTEVYSELLFQRGDTEAFEKKAIGTLKVAAGAANACLKDHVRAYPETQGMGSTLVACVIIKQNLYWISIGDSPLYLFREGKLLQLNEDHSLAPQIDFMVKSGLMSAEEGARHPDRNTLTSVLFGQDIAKVDCPEDPVALQDRDILIVASDGLQFLSNTQIEAALKRHQSDQSAQIVNALLSEVDGLKDPDLDNVSFSLVKLKDTAEAQAVDGDGTMRSGIRCVG